MSTLAFSAGMAAPLVYLSFSFYDRYGFSKKLCNAFCAASCIAAALTALLSIVLKLSVEFAVLKQGAYSFFYCAAWFLALIPTTVLNAADILRPMCRRQKAEEQLP